jgi:mannose-6-phosphate isomerase-like protein (cupin superfamily)
MKTPSVKINQHTAEFFTDEGCYIVELSNAPEDAEVSIARARLDPGVTTQWHQLIATTERYCILSGCGSVEIGDLPAQTVQSGDVVLIPPLCRQRITNTGDDDLIFLAICSPRFEARNYLRLNQ